MANKRVKRLIEMMINPIPMKFYNDVYKSFFIDIIDLKLIYTNILSIDILYKLTKKKICIYYYIWEFGNISLNNLTKSFFFCF